MLEFSKSQIDQIDDLERLQYIVEVCQKILEEYSPLVDENGLSARLERAFKHAVSLGFTKGAAITQFLYYEAFAPEFYLQPAISSWLSKRGQSVEQRLSDLSAQLKYKIRGI